MIYVPANVGGFSCFLYLFLKTDTEPKQKVSSHGFRRVLLSLK